ncbi:MULTISPECIES: hypothetical protein [unclassified Sedimentibacter]|uniref:hypothetical protein n=1 Tax=unclassified Sedimentibacter TaxID=2649220 RepID=UPI0027E07396|nr:hypothetical protein [Sedimentibacter sp. MB35-C1]WMJ76012.1 hypothetical protein RBQ61_10250 [Sedimentibacter sp. MB35-C1]
MIKNYLELNKCEEERFLQFINRNKINKISFHDMDKQLKSEEFDFGNGVIVKVKTHSGDGPRNEFFTECMIYLCLEEM